MVRKIERDENRFKRIVRGRIKSDLRKYISHGEMIGRQGGELISIPMPSIDLPEFRYGDRNSGGAGQGPGEPGTPLTPPRGDAPGGAGDAPGNHILEVELTLEELAELLGEGLELPRIQPKGRATVSEEKDKYNGIRQTGPESLRHFKRTYKRALRRQIASNSYDPRDPVVVPIREDKVYRSWNTVTLPRATAVVFYLMDVSGSMTDEQKEIVRIEAFWIDTWLRSQYDGVATRYVVHDAAAREVDQHTFYHTRESGGTRISSAYALTDRLLERDHPVEDWNIYVFHFSDGDNWSEDNRTCVRLLRENLLPKCNLFCYGQVESPYGSGEFHRELEEHFEGEPRLALSRIRDKSAIHDSIKEFLGRGR